MLEYRHELGCWRAEPPKTPQSYRTIPLTNKAYEILKRISYGKDSRKKSDMLSEVFGVYGQAYGTKGQDVYERHSFSELANWRTCKKTVPMTVTFTSCAMRRRLSAHVCMLCVIRTQQGRLKKGYSLKCCKDFSDMRAHKPLWTDMFM